MLRLPWAPPRYKHWNEMTSWKQALGAQPACERGPRFCVTMWKVCMTPRALCDSLKVFEWSRHLVVQKKKGIMALSHGVILTTL